MRRVYLDTSVYLKAFSDEKGTETVSKLFKACKSGRLYLVASQWTLSESMAVIDRKYRRGEMDLEERKTVIATLLNETIKLAESGNFILVPVNSQLVQASWRIILERHVSADDALHLISGIVTLCEIFISADDYLLRRAEEEGFECYDIENDTDCKKLEKYFAGLTCYESSIITLP